MLTKANVLQSRRIETKVEAYKELFAAFVDVDRAMMVAYMMEESAEQITEEAKKLVGAAQSALIKVFECNRFLLSTEVAGAMTEVFNSRLGRSWGEQCDELRAVQKLIYSIARKDIGTEF
jgi:prophage DNA circulation protein